MLNLIEALETIKQKRRKVFEERDKELAELDAAYNVLFDLNEACLECRGKGKKLRTRSCAEDDRPNSNNESDWIQCPVCKGTGRVKHDC